MSENFELLKFDVDVSIFHKKEGKPISIRFLKKQESVHLKTLEVRLFLSEVFPKL